jgi:hypothetical protein
MGIIGLKEYFIIIAVSLSYFQNGALEVNMSISN